MRRRVLSTTETVSSDMCQEVPSTQDREHFREEPHRPEPQRHSSGQKVKPDVAQLRPCQLGPVPGKAGMFVTGRGENKHTGMRVTCTLPNRDRPALRLAQTPEPKALRGNSFPHGPDHIHNLVGTLGHEQPVIRRVIWGDAPVVLRSALQRPRESAIKAATTPRLATCKTMLHRHAIRGSLSAAAPYQNGCSPPPHPAELKGVVMQGIMSAATRTPTRFTRLDHTSGCHSAPKASSCKSILTSHMPSPPPLCCLFDQQAGGKDQGLRAPLHGPRR